MSNMNPSIGDNIKSSWDITKKNIWVLLGVYVVYLVLVLILNALNYVGSLFVVISFVLSLIVGVGFSLGFVRCCLDALDGLEVSLDAFKKMDGGKFLSYLLASFCVGLVVGIGFILLIIPGIWLALRLMFFTYFIVEENAGPIEAIQKSWDLTKGETSYLIILLLAWIGIAVVGVICLGIGIIVSSIVINISMTNTYRILKSKYIIE